MIEFVFLDLDDTLLDFHAAERGALSKTLRSLGIEPTPAVCARYSEINDWHWKRLERGELTRAQVKLQRFERLFEELGVSADAEAARKQYEENLAIGHVFIDGAEELLRSLFGKYRLFIVSNGTLSVQNGRIASAGIGPYFEALFLSEEIGSVKPQKEFFDVCFSRIQGFDASRAIIVGDSLTSDIQGGINAGIKTCLFNPLGQEHAGGICPDFEIRSLSDLPMLLEKQ